MENKSATITNVIDLLNNALKDDPIAISALVNHKVFCNDKLANHPTIQVDGYSEKGKFKVGLLGILNGFFGIDENQRRYISAIIEDDGTVIRFEIKE